MKKIICFGDSNTYGYNPKNGERFEQNFRWSGILKEKLKENYEIIEEGQNNRTGFADNPSGYIYSARRCFSKILDKNKDAKWVILAIGTNDLQPQYNIGFGAIEKGLEDLILLTKEKHMGTILIPPVVLGEEILTGNFRILFDESSIQKSKKVMRIYKKIANLYNLKYLDFNDFVHPSKIDGLHYDINEHKIIAEKLAEFIEKESL